MPKHLHPQAPSTFFAVLDNGKTFLFDTEECEACGHLCIAANAAHGKVADVSKYLFLGMRASLVPTSELLLTDAGDCVCDVCYSKAAT